ncbi:hypothetical protein, partial [Escherichia coli]|uniref:hypothetical protein n=1 Tax=Escherichia coli TaxID=562 RepID=UPI003B9C6A54
MSIIIPGGEIIKNTVEVLNRIYELPRWSDQFVTSLKYFWNSLSTLKWIDYYYYAHSHFGLILPQNTNSIFSDLINFQTPNYSLLAENQGALPTFFNGFFNSFFLYLPFSPVHFLWLRSVIIQGIWAAGSLASSFGFIFGHLSLVGCCLFGFREIIYTWFGFEPLSYFLGLSLVLGVVFQSIQKGVQIIKKSQKKKLVQIFFINFALVWTEQSSLFPFFGNLSFHSGMNSLDVDYNSTYFLGIFLGSFFWIFLFSSFFRLFANLGFTQLKLKFKLKLSSWIKGFHYFCLIG